MTSRYCPPHMTPRYCPHHMTPQATDESFLQKLHREMGAHGNFVKGADKRLWSVEFGITHYAGPVTYSVEGFLEKNKDVQQDMFFDYLESSSSPFTREITKFRVRLCMCVFRMQR